MQQKLTAASSKKTDLLISSLKDLHLKHQVLTKPKSNIIIITRPRSVAMRDRLEVT